MEKQLQSDGGAEDFGEITSGDGDFADDPKKNGSRAGVGFAAGLGKVAAGDDAKLGGKRLKKHRHEVAEKNDAEEGVAELGAALEVGGPVAGVHVAHGDEVAWAGERENLAEPRSSGRDGNRAMRFREGRSAREGPPERRGIDDGINKFSHFS